MDRQEFLGKVKDRFSDQDLEHIARAYWFAKTVHRGQARNGGERYFEHCRMVACRVLEWDEANASAVIVALLHDCEEEGFIPQNVISDLFDEEIAGAVTTLSKVAIVYDEITGEIKEKVRISDDEYFKRIQDASEQIRRIKLCDRLDNLSTMNVWPEERQRRYIIETEKYVLPIARMTDEWLAEALAKEVSSFYEKPWTYTFKCFECKKEPVAEFTLWLQNKFLKCANFPARLTTAAPLAESTYLRDLFEDKNWQAIQSFLSENSPEAMSWNYFCSKCEKFYCKKCAKDSWWSDGDSWSRIELDKKCPRCSSIIAADI